MTVLEQLQSCYEVYDVQAKDAKKKESPFAGVFGLGRDSRHDRCHDEFFQKVGELISAFAAEDPPAEEADQVLTWLLTTASQHKNEVTYWYLYCIHGYAIRVLPFASREHCEELYQWYGSEYPKRDRMPVQQEIYKELGKCARGKN